MICIIKSSLKIVWKKKITSLLRKKTLFFFFKQNYILFLETSFFKIPDFNCLSISFLPRQHASNRYDHRYTSAKASNSALVKLTNCIIKNDHVINCVVFSVSDKHGQKSNVIWLSTTWLIIFRLEVANKKPVFFTKLASTWTEISW